MTVPEYLSSKGIRYWIRGKNTRKGHISIQCLFHSDRSNHLNISLGTGLFKCWVCGEKGSFSKLIKTIENCEWYEVKKIIQGIQFDDRAIDDEAPAVHPNTNLLKEFLPVLSPLHKRYLMERNFDPEFIQSKYGVMGTEVYGEWKWRLVIPVVMDKKVVSFVARDVTGKSDLRYMSCLEDKAIIKRRDLVYNLDSIQDVMVIVEGPTDVWRMGGGFVATLSTAFSPGQMVAIIKKKPKRVFVLYDPEGPAQASAVKLARNLSAVAGIPVERYEVDLGFNPDGKKKDPGDLSDDDAKNLRKEFFR